MAQPALVQLKRKRNEEPLEYLLLQGVDKEPNGPRYKLQKKEDDVEKDTDVQNPLQQHNPPTTQSNGQQTAEKRIFELQRKPLDSPNIRKRKDASSDHEIATFVEKKHRNKHSSPPASTEEATEPDKPLKRPGKGSTIRTTPTKPPATAPVETESDRKQMEALAAYMHSTLSPPTRPAPVSTPKLSGARSAQIHRQRAATNGSRSTLMDLDDGESYVYDTYILAPSSSADDGVVELDDVGANVGYLVINDDDRSLWEMYLEEDGASDKDWDSEEDDENAENYWAAEYPDEEEWSGSEEGFGYGRRGVPNDEEYHGGMGADSDEDDLVRGGEVPSRFRRFE